MSFTVSYTTPKLKFFAEIFVMYSVNHLRVEESFFVFFFFWPHDIWDANPPLGIECSPSALEA